MDDPRVLRIITVGLVLAALAVVYFLLTGGFSINKPKVNQTQTNKTVQSPTPTPVSSPSPSPTPTPTSAYNTIANRTKGGVETLPRTGFPVGMAVVFSISAIVSGFAITKFPK
jgi:hypothetical protein